jgi:curved DNA-binding protein CbpA
MKKVAEYRELLNVDKDVTLTGLKKIYRNVMKECHPDRFQGDQVALAEAELSSRDVIEAYHYLVSVNPETLALNLPEFKETTANSVLLDFTYETGRLTAAFANGSAYEFSSIPKQTYIKMVNADSPARFAKRHIYGHFPYRKITNQD